MNDLLRRLDKVERLAAASKIGRLLHAPNRYLHAIGFRTLVYVRTKKGLVQRAETFFGLPMQVVLPAGTDIYLTGGKSHSSELRLARFMIQRLEPGQHVVDVGAHFGYFTLLASQLVGTNGVVQAFEASASTFAVLANNVRGQANVTTYHNAVSDREESVVFYEFPVLYNEYNSMHVAQFENEAWFQSHHPVRHGVQAVTLDQAVYGAGGPPDFIKIDVEGAEAQVIRGAEQMLRAGNPYVVIEYSEPKRHNAGHQEAARQLRQYGYESFSLDSAGQLQPCPDLDDYLLRQQLDSDNFVFAKP